MIIVPHLSPIVVVSPSPTDASLLPKCRGEHMVSQVFSAGDSSIDSESCATYEMCPSYGFWEVGKCELSGVAQTFTVEKE